MIQDKACRPAHALCARPKDNVTNFSAPMTVPTDHRCHVTASPWPGVHFTHIESTRHFARHWHDTYGFGLLEQGAQTSASGRGQVDAQAGDLITTNPGEVHDGRPLGGPSRRWRMVYLEPAAMQSLLAAPGSPATPQLELTRPVIQDPRLGQALRQLFKHLDTGTDALACEESLVNAGALLVGRHSTAAAPREACGQVRQVRDRLADDLLTPPTLAELAALAGLSKFQLLRRFAQAYGVPPHAWLLLQRAERARSLIRHGHSLAQAAADSGFADQSHMTRGFARQFGFTPGAWQRAFAPGKRPQ